MDNKFNFFKASMPTSRKADFYLGCIDSCVFLDFDLINKRVFLTRISFDSYGCCNLDGSNCLDENLSAKFIEEMTKDVLDQEKIKYFVLKLITLNKSKIWADALENYGFCDIQ